MENFTNKQKIKKNEDLEFKQPKRTNNTLSPLTTIKIKNLPPPIPEEYKSPREILVPLDDSVKQKAKQKIEAANEELNKIKALTPREEKPTWDAKKQFDLVHRQNQIRHLTVKNGGKMQD